MGRVKKKRNSRALREAKQKRKAAEFRKVIKTRRKGQKYFAYIILAIIVMFFAILIYSLI